MGEQELQAAIEQDRQRRATECSAEIQAALDKHRCTLDVSVVLKAGQVIPQIDIVAKV